MTRSGILAATFAFLLVFTNFNVSINTLQVVKTLIAISSLLEAEPKSVVQFVPWF